MTGYGLRKTVVLLAVTTLALFLAGCSGGGGSTSSTSPGVASPLPYSVSVGSAPDFPAGTTFNASTSSPGTLSPANSPNFDNVFVWVTKLALIPSSGPEFPDRDGQLESDMESSTSGLVTIPLLQPVRIDLLNPPTGRQAACLLDRFSGVQVPAGEYSKIRVYYDNVVGHKNGVTPDRVFHPTAHYHFDVHFVGGNLVIPVDAPQVGIPPQEGIRFFSIVINVVGLKYHEAGKSGNVLLRPQVFAKFVPPILYSVKGTAKNVEKTILPESVSGAFIVEIGGMSPVPVTFDNNTTWAYSDNVLFRSPWRILDVPNQRAADAFRSRAQVKVIGWFDGGTLRGMGIMFTFPEVKEGVVDNGWTSDNTFVLRLPQDNVVFPKPDRYTAYYDNAIADPIDNTHHALAEWNIDNNVRVKARGYAFDAAGNPVDGIEAYWISIGP